MQIKTFLAAALVALLVACGGGGDDASPTNAPVSASRQQAVLRAAPLPTETVIANQTVVTIGSDAGDYIGGGRSYTYTQLNSIIQVSASNGLLRLRIDGDQYWGAEFALPASRLKFNGGTFTNLERYPFHDPAVGGISWSGEGRGCNTLVGAFRVNSSEYVGSELVAVDIDFVQHCEGRAPALYGNIRWFANDPTVPRGPVRNIPDRLWSPALDATPATGNFVYLESDSGDYIGLGAKYTYTQRNAKLAVSQANGKISVSVNGNEWWSGDFQAMNVLRRVRPGLYRNLQRYPFHNPTLGGLSWSGDGRGCNTLTGWFAVDEITYVDGELDTLDMRFEQHCEGGPASLHGRIRWNRNDTLAPLGPRRIPTHLWAPPEGATPAAGNYVYLHSPPGDWIGQGQDYLYNTGISVSAGGRSLNVNVGGWGGEFVAMDSIARIKRGFYPGVQRYPFHNTAIGGMDWSGNGRGCNELEGWFAIDNIVYDSLGLLMALDMRFSQRCDGGPPLRGEVHWVRPS
jgi:hypothetical protein